MSHKPIVLIVDDDATNLGVLDHILSPLYLVRVARTGLQALKNAVSSPQPDLVLLDIGLVDMDGYAVLEQLKSSPATRDIPVIFVTARDTTEDEEYGFDQGAVDYITKPIRPPVVLARVQLHLKLQQAQRALAEQNVRLEETLAERTAELEHSQRQIMQAEKMAAIGLLAGGIAHDFNNILGAIIGYTEMSLEDIDDHPIREFLQQVHIAGLRAKDLVQQILIFARKSDYEKRPVQVGLIVKETLQLLRASLPATIAIESDIAGDAAEAAVLGEPTKIHQILMNICTNAAHAMKEGGCTLAVSLTRAAINAETARRHQAEVGPSLKLTIADTGHGMPAEIQEKIFEPYFTTKGQGEGTGLGLSVVYGIVQSLKGCIAVDSQPGRGTTFAVSLPLLAASAVSAAEEKAPLAAGSGTVLLVDDEAALVKMVQVMLQRMGYEVVACRSGAEALAAFRREPERFDLVVTDQTMPRMTGVQLARELLATRPELPVILCSGYSETAVVDQARLTGIRGILAKPFNPRQLGETIAACRAVE